MFVFFGQYFEYKLTVNATNTTTTDDIELENSYKNDFLSYIGLAAQVPNVLFNVLNTFFQFGYALANVSRVLS